MNLDLNKYFLNNTDESINSYIRNIQDALEMVIDSINDNNIFSGKDAGQLINIVNNFKINEQPQSLESIIENKFRDIFKNSLNINSPASMAHLHCPVMIPSLVAELFISLLNQSMDSWDQSPIATYIEQNIINWLSSLIYINNSFSDGIFTSGGTQSNLMGLLLARDYYCENILNHKIADLGLPNIANRFRILCTEKTHFSVHKSLSILGLGKNSIELIKTDHNLQLDTQDLLTKIVNLKAQNLIPICIVTTVGDTDFGCIDNIKEIAEIANKNNIWLHADAAVGGAVILSDKYKHRLNGLELADSVTVDFHKLFFQPISCGAFFCKDKSYFKLLSYHADYLNPDDDGFDCINLVDKSIQTTRRFDALKIFISLQSSGTKLFSEWINHIIQTTTSTIKIISNDEHLQLAFKEYQHLNNSLNTIVFRYFNKDLDLSALNSINSKIHKLIFHSGRFAIAQTKVNKNIYLKITLVNPMITQNLINDCLTQIKTHGDLLKNQIEVSKND
ncbi:pyridoxal-dependent decarboxylase [Francisella sp. LA112445]|uniref:pyridoxal phosphate-dependent decarboxylase family protein n=1 Tax=Francisella sp. LA112445 TaxID=1395624 RepID=UPI001788D655|nr:pyridoxal-dependent decarboxylase [Francisella sp. LA112445]QIW10929.1 diaminobutyrate decarboxylase [Francisella sp. LA112445]